MTDKPSNSSENIVENRNHRGAARWLWMIIFIAATVALVAGGYAYYRHETSRITQQKYEEIAAIGKLKAGQIDQWRQERINDLERSSGGRFFVRGLQEFLRDRNNTVLQQELQHRLAMEREVTGYSEILVLDLGGHILLSAQSQSEPLSPFERGIVEDALAKRCAVLSHLFRTPQGSVMLDGAVPLLDQEGQPFAVLLMRSNAESLLYPLIQSWPTPSRTAETVLVRKDGENILFLNDLRHRANSALYLREPLDQQNFPAVQAVLGKQGMFLGKDYRGVEVLADLRPIPNSPWFMVAKLDTSEILAEAHYRGSVTAVFTVLFVLLAASAVAYGYRHRQSRLYKDLYRWERKHRDAEEQFRTILYSIGDAVITTDTQGLVKQMNPMAESLTGWPEGEAAGRPLEEVFHIIDEKTRQRCENPVRKVLRERQVVGLANHTALIGRDGTERVLADSGAPIRAESGDITGVVLVFRDVTERARAAEELLNREGMLRTILAASPVGIVLTQDGRIKWANDSWVGMFGFTKEEEWLDRPTTIMYPSQEDHEGIRRILYDHLDAGQVSETDARLKRKDGTSFDGHLRMKLVDNADPSKGTISAISDISDRKKAEEALRDSGQRMSQLINFLPDATLAIDREGRVIAWNRAIEEMTGVSANEMLGKGNYEYALPFFGTRRPILIDLVLARTEEIRQLYPSFKAEKDVLTVESENATPLGKKVTLWAKAAPLYDVHGTIIGAIETIRDITESKLAQEELAKSRQLLQAILDAFPAGVAMLRNRQLEWGNRTFEEILGVSPEEIRGHNVSWLYASDEEYRRVGDTLYPDLAKGVVRETEVLLRHRDGSIIPCLLRLTLVDETPGGKAVVALFMDITERKRAADALRESESKYRSVVENMQDVFYRTDMEGIITMVSPSGPELLGCDSVDEMIGLNIKDLYKNPEERDRALAIARESGRVSNYELEFARRDGKSIMVSSSSHFYHDESGKPLGTEGVLTDITRRKQAEEALKESEEWYRSIVEEGFDGVLVHKGPRIIYANSVLHQMLGYSAGELVGLDHWSIYHPIYRQAVRERGRARMRGAIFPYQYEVQLQRKDGSYFDGEINARAVTVKGEPGVRVWVRDISKRKRLEEVQRRLATAIEQAGEAVVMTDVRGNVEYVNPAHEQITGYTREEVVGSFPPFFKKHELDLELQRELSDSIREGRSWSHRLAGRRKDGTLCEIDVTIAPVRDASGRIVSRVGVHRDVTQEVRLQQQLLQAQKMEAIGTLAGGVAHDFNNLLTVVAGFSELLLEAKDQDNPEYGDLQKIYHAAKNGAELVQRLLMFSRKSEPKPVPIDLNKQIVQVEKLLRRTIPKMIEIRLDLSSDLPDIHADPSQIEQVLMNLAVNARDAMQDAGKLTVKTDSVTLDQEYCRLHVEANPGEYVLLEISDTGHGMDKETIEHIFEPFFTTKEIGRGTGLGLAMVYGIVKQHDGHVSVYSEVGKGTVFRVYLPAMPAEEEPAVEQSGIMLAFGTETLLLVDDEELVRELGTRILTKYGYTVLWATNGREALDLFKKERSRISLVILDLIMPEMGGTECLKQLLEIDPKVNVLIASGYSADAQAKETMQIGAKGFVSKPFRVKELLRAIRRILDEG